MILQTFIFISFLLITSCESAKKPVPRGLAQAKSNPRLDVPGFPYDLNNIDEVINLSSNLVEISGLTYLPETGQLAGVNDEKGNIYLINSSTGQIEQKIDFGSGGDYEGVELVDDKIYVVKSNGNIYCFDMKTQTSEKVIKTALKTSNDVEGLAYDFRNNTLLLACKGNPAVDQYTRSKKTKAVYAFDLDKKVLKLNPLVTINDDELVTRVRADFATADLSKKKFSKLLSKAAGFSPSAIAIHPITEDIYILSSVGKILVILDKAYKVKMVVPLDGDIHRQPEGICFSPDGRMYISNEGRGLVAKIISYSFIKEGGS